jgi:hypothetical protein
MRPRSVLIARLGASFVPAHAFASEESTLSLAFSARLNWIIHQVRDPVRNSKVCHPEPFSGEGPPAHVSDLSALKWLFS